MEFIGFQNERPPELRHRLDHVHARQHRITRKMPLEKRFVDREVLVAYGAFERFEVGDAIDEEHRVAMRQDLHDLADRNRLLRCAVLAGSGRFVVFDHARKPTLSAARDARSARRFASAAACKRWPLLIGITSQRGQAPKSARSPIRSSTLWRTTSLC